MKGQNCNPIDTFIYIADNQSTSVQITIDNILNNDLSDPLQCLLGIQLEFEHDHIGDLSITLISPGGDEVQLIGPNVVNFPTPFTNWNVFFTSCAAPTAPDPPNFPDVWSNEANWAAFGNYTGIYHPYQGCMEDFDSGPVNGTWTLNINDHIEFDSGNLIGINFFFCDPTGMDCDLCDAHAGEFEIDNMLFCEGDPSLMLEDPNIIFDTIPDPDKYYYTYFSTFQDSVYSYQNALDLINAAPGIYEICGISYYKNDSSFLDSLYSGMALIDLVELMNHENSTFCGEITDTCMSIEILPAGEVVDSTVFLCPGDTIFYGDSIITEIGDYFLVDETGGLCDLITRLNVQDYGLEASIDALDFELDCVQNIIDLSATSPSLGPEVSYAWSTTGGAFSGNIDQLTVSVIQPGIYYFVLEKNSCFDTTSVTIFSDGTLPEYAVSAPLINCSNPSITIELTPFTPINSVTWTDPNSNVIIGEDPLVNVSGSYFFEIEGVNGCISLGEIEIGIDTIYPSSNLSSDTITCLNPDVQILFESPFDITDIYWPEADSYDEDPIVSEPGIYHVEYAGSNGCVSIDSIDVAGDLHPPNLIINYPEIDCYSPEILIDVSYSDDTLSFNWTDPDGNMSQEEDFTTGLEGWHELSVINEYSCTLDTLIYIFENLTPPAFVMIDTLVLACNEDSVKLAVQYFDAFDSVEWTGPGGFSNNFPEPFVELVGTYVLEVTGKNGCISSDSTIIVNPPEIEEVDFTIDSINCQNSLGGIHLVYSGDLSFSWLDENDNAYTGEDILSNNGGFYYLTITDNEFNCTSEMVIELSTDTIPPDNYILDPDTLNCLFPSVELSLDNYNGLNVVHWTGNGFDSYDQNPLVNQTGWFYVEMTGSNHCLSYDSILVIEEGNFLNDILPFYIDCSADSIQINIQDLPPANYSWTLQGNSFSSDEEKPWVHMPGTYQVIVETLSGCKDSTLVEVIEIKDPPEIYLIQNGEINCLDSLVNLDVLVLDNIISSLWTGPNLNTTELSPDVSLEGSYYFEAEGENHCMFFDSIEIKSNLYFPEIEATGDSITCSDPDNELYISANVDSTYLDLYWQGPDFYYSDLPLNPVQDTGLYVLIVEGSKGCFSYDSAYILVDTLSPEFFIISSGIINCYNDSINLQIDSDENIKNVNWTGPGNFYAEGENITAYFPGNYWITALGENGCERTISFQVEQNKLKPYIDIEADELSCKNSKVPLILSTNIQDYIVDWEGPNNYTYTGQNPAVLESGLYFATITDLDNGCQNIDSVYVGSNYELPLLSSSIFKLGCNGDSIEIFIVSDPPNVNFTWTGPGTFLSYEDKPLVSEPGIYYVNVERKDNGCSVIDSVIVSSIPEYPTFNLSYGDLNCKNDSITVILQDSYLVDSLFWTGPGPFSHTGESPVIYESGEYFLSVKGSNGCILDTTFSIVWDTILPEIQIVYDDFLACEKITATLNATGTSSGSDYYYQWNTTEGNILTGGNTLFPLIEGQGYYNLEVINIKNHCHRIDSIFVEERESMLDSISLFIKTPTCFGFSDGEIRVIDVFDAYEPAKFSLDGSPYYDTGVFTDKSAGNYLLSIKDAYGCQLDTNVIIGHGSGIQLVLTATEEHISIGESSILEAVLITSNDISYIEWQPANLINDPDELSNEVSPIETTLFSIYAEDIYGCKASDQIKIYVKDDPTLFIPNIFTPNGDDTNDRFYVQGGDSVEKIIQMEIYDRWGNLLYQVNDISLHDYQSAWDGTFRGKAVNPGVYIYRITFLGKNGKSIQVAGDLTLLR